MLRRVLSSVVFNRDLINKSTKLFCTNMEPQGIRTIDYKVDQYGDYPFLKSLFRSHRKWTAVKDVDEKLKGEEVLVRARIHNIRSKGNSCFIILREGFATVQALAFKGDNMPKQMIKYMAAVPNESIVDLVGTVSVPEQAIASCSQQVEIQITKFFVVNRADPRLPLQISDASRKVTSNEFDPEEEDEVKPEEKKEEPKVEETKTEEPKVEETKAEETKPEGAEGEATQEGGENKPKKAKKEKKEKKEKVERKQKEDPNKEQPIVKMKTRLDNRIIDLRTPAKHAIFRLQSGVCQIYREFLLERDFVEIHSPKLIGGSSEGGSNVFTFSYFNRKACLAQSPQLYKQMSVMGDFQRVFEIGPVFRAENSFTHRHMCEFVGLDLEMSIKEHYFEVLEFFGELFPYLFENLAKRFERQLKAINEQFEFEPFKCKTPVVKLTFEEGIDLLKENGVEWPKNEDLDTPTEKKLGELVRQKYDTDFYMLHRYPQSARPFYTTLCEDNPEYTCSYDFFMRGEEILSGAQRIHDPNVLKERAVAKGIDPESIKDYIDCFKYGAYPHGGGGIGLERVVMLFCALKNIRNASLFPRDPKRITP